MRSRITFSPLEGSRKRGALGWGSKLKVFISWDLGFQLGFGLEFRVSCKLEFRLREGKKEGGRGNRGHGPGICFPFSFQLEPPSAERSSGGREDWRYFGDGEGDGDGDGGFAFLSFPSLAFLFLSEATLIMGEEEKFSPAPSLAPSTWQVVGFASGGEDSI